MIDKKKENNELSKKFLLEQIKKKIMTTMIGSLDVIEKAYLGDTKDLEQLKNFKEVRKKILDLGNDQILRIEKELNNYDVELTHYTPKNLVKPKV